MPKRKFSGSYGYRKKPRTIKSSGYRYGRSGRRPGRRYTKRANLATMGFLGIEKKFYDTSLSGSALVVGTTLAGTELDPSATSMISTPVQGDGEQNRDGKQISCMYMELNGTIKTIATETTVNPVDMVLCYVAVVLDTQTNGAQLNSEDVFKNTSAGVRTSANPMKNLLFGKRFRILKAKCFNLSPKSPGALAANDFNYNSAAAVLKWFIPLRGLKINFNGGTTASVANVIDNSIHVIGWTSSDTLAPEISYNARLRFMG